ncbi:MAG: SMP-30/gluconolactonase/LRE family protein [Verrucomicrobiota bacterium]
MKTNRFSIFLLGATLASAAPAILAEPSISNFMAAPGNAQVALSWNGSTNATGYNVKQATSATGLLTVIATNLPDPGLVVTNVRNGIVYFFAISSVSDGFESADTPRLPTEGRLFMCNYIAGSSMRVFEPDGRSRSELAVPEPPTNLCFGGENREMLFITASTGLYGITRMPDQYIIKKHLRRPADAIVELEVQRR